jgi:polyhydroxyalkanoate synthesis regulator phasin
MKPHHISTLIDQLQASGKLPPEEKRARKDLSQEAWEIHQKIGQPQQGQEAQASWDAMQEKHLAQVEREIEELETKTKA